MAIAIPPIPPARGYETSGAGKLHPRYEDVTQDGRVQLLSLPVGLGVVWRALGEGGGFGAYDEHSVLPIMRRMIVVGEVGPFSPFSAIAFEGTWRLARDADGTRLFVNMWLDARAPRGGLFDPAPPADAEGVLVGRVFAEHVITRPFARTPDARKVTRLERPGLPEVPLDVHAFETADALLEGLTPAPVLERAFGRMHTDSNQHVNSLVYGRMFEETLVERVPEGTLARAMDVRFRKPFFGGDRAVIALDLRGERAAGSFAPPGPGVRPHTAIALELGLPG